MKENTMDTDRTLAAIVDHRPGAARIFERHRLDYCCGGGQTLAAACAGAGVDPDEVLAKLEALPSAVHDAPEWVAMDLVQLVDHLEATHHRYLHEELPRLSALVAKVVGVHGDRHPELHQVQQTYEALRSELEPHLAKEEQVLFPMVRELAAATTTPSFHCGTLTNPIRVMLMEHDSAGELLAELRTLTADHVPPADGCASYRTLYASLADLEADTHLHIHKENNVLFPAVVAKEQELAARNPQPHQAPHT
jgi:regulator of cell morphogenesis and NO signaling